MSDHQSATVPPKKELEEYCYSDSLSERGLRELFARHGLTPNKNRLSNYEFFFWACWNERVTEGIIQCLLEYFPAAASATDEDGWSPLHTLCLNKNATLNIIQLLVDAAPDSVRSVDPIDGDTPLHYLCGDGDKVPVDEPAALEILKFLIDKYPEAARHADNTMGRLPIHEACKRRSGEFCQVLINTAPDTVRSQDNGGMMPLHFLCGNQKVDDAAAKQILKLLIEKYQEAVRHADNDGDLPIHFASKRRSPEFCRVLIEAYPGSLSMPTTWGELPLHYACSHNSLATIDYLYQQYPNAINYATTGGYHPGHYPIHAAISRYNSATTLETVQFLLDCDPNQKLKKFRRKSLLHFACEQKYYSHIETRIQLIKLIFDAHPEAIEDNRISSKSHNFHQQVQAFINGELVYARQAKDHRLMITPDDNGQLPLHKALRNNVRLGSIKLLVKGNPSALRYSDDSDAKPLHIACQHHDSASVVSYLLELDTRTLRFVDIDNNTALHYACRGAKHDTIALLLEKYDAASVSKRNAHDKLPIHLLIESNEVSDRESVEYTGSVFRLLQANPEMVLSNSTIKPSDVEAIRHGKKRALLPRFEPPLFQPWWGLSLLYHLAILFWLLRSTNAIIAVCVLSTFFLLLSICIGYPRRSQSII